MSFTEPHDPFLEAQTDVLCTLQTTRSLFASYIRIRSSASSAYSPELTEARKELETTVQDLSTDLQDLVDSVKAVEGDSFHYGLDIDEVERRRKLVQDAGDELESMRQELAKTVVGAQSKGQGINGSLPPPSAFDPDDPQGDNYEAFEQQQQVQMLHDQDEALDGVFKTVGNLRQQADDMGRELEEQEEMLEDVDKLADRVQGKLANGIKRVGWVIKHNEAADAGNRNHHRGPYANQPMEDAGLQSNKATEVVTRDKMIAAGSTAPTPCPVAHKVNTDLNDMDPNDLLTEVENVLGAESLESAR